jgi:UDP-sugar pyrophosphorylase
MLRAANNGTAFPDGDVNLADTGVSPFPGNMNQLVFKLSTYVETLARCGGIVPEFVNPKYVDASRTAFKKPTRLECMMQDLPRQLPPGSNVGFTTVSGGGDGPDGGRGMDCIRFYSPVKNNVVDAAKKQRAGGSAACASSGEAQVYETTCRLLRGVGVDLVAGVASDGGRGGGAHGDAQELSIKEADEVNDDVTKKSHDSYLVKEWLGIRVREYPRVVLPPQCSLTSDWCRACFQGNVTLTQRSTLLVKGEGNVVFRGNVVVDGALVVETGAEGEVVTVEDVEVRNKGWTFEPLEEDGAPEQWPEYVKIRGYHIVKHETTTI